MQLERGVPTSSRSMYSSDEWFWTCPNHFPATINCIKHYLKETSVLMKNKLITFL